MEFQPPQSGGVVNPTANKEKKAAALAYSPPHPAPFVLASGKGREAERILLAAREAGIDVVEDPALAALLEAVEPGDYIPPWCWEAAAQILAFVCAKEQHAGEPRVK